MLTKRTALSNGNVVDAFGYVARDEVARRKKEVIEYRNSLQGILYTTGLLYTVTDYSFHYDFDIPYSFGE